MARVFIDGHMFGCDWFLEVLPTLLSSKNVRFAYAPSQKLLGELGRVRKGLEFYRRMGDIGRRDDAPQVEAEGHIRFLTSQRVWVDCSDCDDAHIFAIVFLKPVAFVFTEDSRIARCRDRINSEVSGRYCGFSLIKSSANFKIHRSAILN